ncbi:xanthine dehydrogenase accessory protein XdhC [Fulvimarina sp. MAC3]|uniref:xanthine dehydrogenase accessory protein XdhC n=1 Tax=Fulvimarina sp. MAC3 TaxID=3148887 RepID=UPI0031FBBFFE
MSGPNEDLAGFLEENPHLIAVTLTRVRGSSPRGEGTEMFVSAEGLWGTIGGGQLEFRAIEAARRMLRDAELIRVIDLPLGPEIGQCCGGRVEITLRRMRASDKRAACARVREATENRPNVYILGAGHVGRGLADLFQHLPVRCILVDQRAQEVGLCSAKVEMRVSAMPEIDVAHAPKGSAFIVLTHDHGLDFLLASAALERRDASYVGMIGSATKRAKFRSWMRENSNAEVFDDLVCPIGGNGSRDKRPHVIAAFVIAEVMAALTDKAAKAAVHSTSQTPARGEHTDRVEARH